MGAKPYQDTDSVSTIEDEKKRVIDLNDFNLVLPSVDIFDAPTRCYTVNLEWAKIITGAIDLLTEIAVWKDATDEGYIGIRKILEFLRGDNCMTFDCDDVEDCLETSLIIDAINVLISQNTTDITNLTSRVTNNEGTLATHTIDIAQNAADIVLQAVLINDNFLAIGTNDTELANHETRITALETGGGGGGSSQVIQARIETIISDYTVDTVTDNFGVQIPDGFHSLRIEVLFAGDAGYPNLFMYFNNDLTNSNYLYAQDGSSANEPRVGGGNNSVGLALGSFSQVTLYIKNLDLPVRRTVHAYHGRRNTDSSGIVMRTRFMYWESSDTIVNINFKSTVGNFGFDSNIKIWGIKETDILVPAGAPSVWLVTFDIGGDAYSIDFTCGSTAQAIGGNPDNCQIGYTWIATDYLEIEINLGAVYDIDKLEWDAWTNSYIDTSFVIKIDGVFQGGSALGIATQDDTWESHSEASFNPPKTGLNGQVIVIRMTCASNSFAEARMDNFKVTYS